MKIGVPKEIKALEHRVAATPAGVHALVKNNHAVYVESNAGAGSGFSDESYLQAGAIISQTPREIFETADMILKVKEPLPSEYELIREGQIVFTYFHFASSKELTLAMVKQKAICIAYETVELPDRSLPLLIPMSEVAGRMSIQQGAKYLEKTFGGKGKLLGGVPGVPPANVMIIGGGIVGTHAAWMAAGLGANVSILDTNLSRLRYLNEIMPENVYTTYSDSYTIEEMIKTTDLVIGAVLNVGEKAPVLIGRDTLKMMQPGTVLVDVAIDQGGCFQTSKPTTHENPVYTIDHIVHYCVANIPGAVPQTSTRALTNATLPYVLKIANHGWAAACEQYDDLKKGLNIVDGRIVYKAVADTFGLEYTDYCRV